MRPQSADVGGCILAFSYVFIAVTVIYLLLGFIADNFM